MPPACPAMWLIVFPSGRQTRTIAPCFSRSESFRTVKGRGRAALLQPPLGWPTAVVPSRLMPQPVKGCCATIWPDSRFQTSTLFSKHKSCQMLSILVEGKPVGHRPQAAQRDFFRVAQVLEVVPLPAARIAARAVQQIFALHDIGVLPLLPGNRAGVGDALGHLPASQKFVCASSASWRARFRFGEALGGLGVFAGSLFTELGRLLRLTGGELALLGRFGQPGLARQPPVQSPRQTIRAPATAAASPAITGCAGTIARPLPRARSDASGSALHSKIGTAPEIIPALRGKTPVRVFLKALERDRLKVLGNVRVELPRAGRVVVDDLLDQHPRVAAEGSSPVKSWKRITRRINIAAAVARWASPSACSGDMRPACPAPGRRSSW